MIESSEVLETEKKFQDICVGFDSLDMLVGCITDRKEQENMIGYLETCMRKRLESNEQLTEFMKNAEKKINETEELDGDSMRYLLDNSRKHTPKCDYCAKSGRFLIISCRTDMDPRQEYDQDDGPPALENISFSCWCIVCVGSAFDIDRTLHIFSSVCFDLKRNVEIDDFDSGDVNEIYNMDQFAKIVAVEWKDEKKNQKNIDKILNVTSYETILNFCGYFNAENIKKALTPDVKKYLKKYIDSLDAPSLLMTYLVGNAT